MKALASSEFCEHATPDEPSVRINVANDVRRDLLDRGGAAEVLDVSPRTLDRWHVLRIGPPRIKIGGRVRYRLTAIQEWLRSCETADLK